MSRCEDFPCCGHEPGCCPDCDESGKQLNMKCTCGATLPLNSRYSICDGCMACCDEESHESWDELTEDELADQEDRWHEFTNGPAGDYDGDF